MTAKFIKIAVGKTIKNRKGNIIKFVNFKSKLFKKFGELYFTEIKLNKKKGWNYHKKNTCLMCVPFGKVKFNIYNSKKNKIVNVILSSKNNHILQIPPQIWFSFMSLTKKSIVANVLDDIHKKSETRKKNLKN